MHIADSDLLVPPTSPICLKVLVLGGVPYIYVYTHNINIKVVNTSLARERNQCCHSTVLWHTLHAKNEVYH